MSYVTRSSISCIPPERTNIFLSLSLIAKEQPFFLALDVLCQIYFCLYFSFPDPLPGPLDNFCVFLSDCFSLLTCSVSYVFKFLQELLVHCFSFLISSCIALEPEEDNSSVSSSALGLLFPPWFYPMALY